MTEPTDAAIDTLILEHGVMAQAWPTQRQLHAFARAVLAKWGTPAPVEVGAVPQGWKAVPVNPTPEMWKAAKTVPAPNPPYPPHYGLVWDAMLAAAPQPIQPQAGAVPLTDAHIRAMLNKHPPEDVCAWSYRMGIDDAELHHGIKGGQHGTDT